VGASGTMTDAATRRADPGRRPPRPARRRRPRRGWWVPYALLSAAALTMAVTIGWPVVKLVVFSLQRQNLSDLFAHRTVWVGLGNYTRTLKDPTFWTVTRRSLAFTVLCVGATMAIGVGMALLMQHVSRWARILLSATLVLVWSVPNFIASIIWKWLFDSDFGVANYLVTRAHLCDCAGHQWFQSPAAAFLILAAVIVWGAVPFVTLAVYGALLTVPADLYEAARVDGARAWTTFRRITVPLIAPVLAILAILSMIWDTKVFPQVWFLTRGGPFNSTVMLGPYIYLKGISTGESGQASAIAVLMTLMLAGLAWFYLRTLRREEA
jgi:N,N'-diacetylchitobiose transport system permease protein